MQSVGIRELRQNASAVIRRVALGESIEVTDRGRPVARLVPLTSGSTLDQMVSDGTATYATRDILDITPLVLPAGSPSLSSVLADMRADER